MKKEYILKGLSCPNCAVKIEHAVKELSGVNFAFLNFANSTLKVEWANSYKGDPQEIVQKTIKRIESGVTVAEKTREKQQNSPLKEIKFKIACIIIGAVFFVTGLILENTLGINENVTLEKLVLGYTFGANAYITLTVYVIGYLVVGGDILLRAVKNIVRGKIFGECFLMGIATLGAFIIGHYHEAVGVMLFFKVGELFQDLAVKKAKKSIARLMDICPDFANILKDGEIIKAAPETAKVGDLIIVKPGERIPLDGLVTEGETFLDTAALTGESKPRKVSVNDSVFSGSINLNGVLTIKVTESYGQSTASRIIELVENAAEKKAPTENFITTFARYYSPIVTVLALVISIIPPLLFGGDWLDWLNRAFIFLVISCPCALVISIPLGFFGGLGRASRQGVLIKGGNYLEALNKLSIVVFDKTGTLTKGVFKVTKIEPSLGFTKEELIKYAAKAEALSNHPIALSILHEYGKKINKTGLKDYLEIAGHGVRVNDNSKIILAGNQKLLQDQGIEFVELQNTGTKVYVSIDGAFAGCIVISDEIKPDSKKLVERLNQRGIRSVMLTGDNFETANSVATELSITEFYAGLLPQAKVEKVEWLKTQIKKGGKLIFMGDGLNDAPVLALSDIGVSMGGLGTDAAIEASDVVIMTDEPSKLIDAITTAKFTRRIVWQNILFALVVKAVFLALGATGIATMWAAVFADVGVTLLAVLNSLRVIRINDRKIIKARKK
ncbi:MAG: cadmium-translocating P-type ATPase [Firmicutes bacterium]|nr:cadmium-translocating P-type ATPase [Bacillota bacterium]